MPTSRKTKVFKRSLIGLLGLIVGCLSSSLVYAATAFTEGYHSTNSLSVGTVVSITKNGGSQIEPATADNDSRLIGVIAQANSSIIDVQPKGSNIRVAISGDTEILVTDSGGNINKGDSLIISSLAGIAMHDQNGTKASKYIAVAKESFSSSSPSAQKVNVNVSGGSQKVVSVGKITATVLISERKPSQTTTKPSNFLTSVGEKIAKKKVSNLRVIGSIVVILLAFSMAGWLINASVKGSFTSLGRNPLAKISIMTNLMRVIVLSVFIFAIGAGLAYLLLVL